MLPFFKHRQKNQRKMVSLRQRFTPLFFALGLAGTVFGIIVVVQQSAALMSYIKDYGIEKLSLWGCRLTYVAVLGRQNTSKQDVLKLIAPLKEVPLGKIDLCHLQQCLERLPWVKTVILRRTWPDSLWIRFVEREAIAVWQHQGNFSLVDETGTIIVKISRQSPYLRSLFLVTGEEAPFHVEKLLKALEAHQLLKTIKKATYLSNGRWNLYIDQWVIKMPQSIPSSLLQALPKLPQALKKWMPQDNIEAVDLRFWPRTILVDVASEDKEKSVEKEERLTKIRR